MFLKQHQSAHPKGFALVVTLSLMILLTIVAVGLLTLSSVSLRATNHGEAMATARANARMALILALGDLQQTAGPDQRITAPADILPASTPATLGRSHWTGVWNTSAFSPAKPDTKTFVRWLVSDTPTSVGDAKASAGPDDVLIFRGKDPAASVKVPKVAVNSGTANVGAYAYWVEDEGLKADLGWSEGVFSNAAQKQAARLAAAPGPDYASLDGPFTGKVNYPLAQGTSNAWLANLDKALSAADMPLVMTTTNDPAWLRDKRHDITMGSRGVMADVKLGGLRRDLSLAFEMDGTADVSATSQPAKFNLQLGEFVGGNDRLAAPQAAQGMGGVKERFLYRDTQASGTPFSGDIATSAAVIRGPNWWCLRDYANLYKRLSGTAGDYTLDARACYPNLSAAPSIPAYSLSALTGVNQGATSWDSEFTTNTPPKYIFRPARANGAPVLLGSVCLFSALATPTNATTAKLALGLDPFFYLWNPYNRKLQFNKFAIRAPFGFPGHVTFYVNRNGVRTQYGPSTTRDYLSSHAGVSVNAQAALTYLISGLTMAPGEIIVVSPSSNRSASATTINDEALPGTNTDNASGVILTKIPVADATNTAIAWQEVPLNLATDTVEFTYSNQYNVTNQVGGTVYNANYFMLHTSLPPAGMTAKDMATAAKTGEQLQALDNNTLGGNAVPEYYYPGQNQVVPPVGPYAANTLLNTKNFFGALTFLAKPTSFSGQKPNPVEVFAQFNPMPVGSTINDMWRPCNLNQVYNMVSRAGGANTLLNECAIAFPASDLRNGYWGASYAGGSTALPMSNIPSGPLFSLVSFSHAGLAIRANEPFHALGNSWANLFVSPVSPYGLLKGTPGSWPARTASDSSWLLNDALFDRYYLSGIAPEFTLNGGYSASGSLTATLGNFFGANFRDAKANPVLRPYLPPNESATTTVNALGASDGYKKMGAYSLIDGAFNVNSTSIPAWTALLRGNRSLGVDFAQGGSDGASGVPYPASTSPSAPGNGSAGLWSGFSRLSDAQIDTLAAKIVVEVKLRGPFMSLADFINHRVGMPKTAANYMGALQAAIEASGINSSVQSGAGGVAPVYTGAISTYLPDPPPVGARKTTTGIPTDITQADLLLPLAPRIAARSDTFRIRGYGETRAKDGVTILARATCEAVVQRFPEYMDPTTDAANNEPWDEPGNPLAPSASSALNPINQKFGRRFKMVQFHWLSSSEI